MQQRLRDYIDAVMQHFPNVYAWDVVNEVASDTPNDANPYRTDSPWYRAYSVGGLRRRASTCAMRSPSPRRRAPSSAATAVDMKLMINDYNTENCRQARQRPRHRARPAERRHVRSTASATSSTCSSVPTSPR